MMTTQAELKELVAAEADAWNKGDAHAFSTRCTEDISFTNIIGTSTMDALPLRSQEALLHSCGRGNCRCECHAKLPSGIQTGDDGVLRTRLLLAVAPLPVRGQLYGRLRSPEPSVFHLEQKEPLTSAAHAALRRTALMHCRKQLRESEECFLLR